MFPEYHVVYKALHGGADVPPVIAAAAAGSVEMLRALVPPPGAPRRAHAIQVLRAGRFTDPQPWGVVQADDTHVYSPAQIAAAGNHTGFLAAWAELVGPFKLWGAFEAALHWFADESVAWLLENLATLDDAADGNRSLRSIVADRNAAQELLLKLAVWDYRFHRKEARTGPLAAARDYARSQEACRRCFRILGHHVFARFQGYPNQSEQFVGTEHLRSLLLGTGLWVTYESLKELGHGPTNDDWLRYLSYLKTTIRKSRPSSKYFVRVLWDFFRDDAGTRLQILNWIRDYALLSWRNPDVLKQLLDCGAVSVDGALLSSSLHLSQKLSTYVTGFPGRRDLFLYLRMVLTRLSAAVGCAGAGANDLAAAIDASQDPKGPISGRRSFVLLLLFFGARGPSAVLEKIVKGGGKNAYRGLTDDLLEVSRWKRWIANRSIGGLPPEIAQENMFETWIEMLR